MSRVKTSMDGKQPCVELLDEAIVEVLRRKTVVERVGMIFAANRTMRLRLEGHLRTLHPDWDTRPLCRRLRGGWAVEQDELLRHVVDILEEQGVVPAF
jgi:hypothetical protein